MTFPFITAITAGVLLILQILLAFTVSGARGQNDTWVGDGGKPTMLRTMRRHGNLAENAAIFIIGFALLELSGFNPTILAALCGAFILVRVSHAAGLSRENTNNPLRLIGGVGTYMLGLGLGGLLIWTGYLAAVSSHVLS